jgi:hypothetical protein
MLHRAEKASARSFCGAQAVVPESFCQRLHLGLNRAQAIYDRGTAPEQRHTMGTRFFRPIELGRLNQDSASKPIFPVVTVREATRWARFIHSFQCFGVIADTGPGPLNFRDCIPAF